MAHLKKLAQRIEGTHGVAANVLASVVRNPVNLIALVASHDSLDAMIKTTDAVGQTDSFAEWADAAEPFLDLSSAEWQVYRVLQRNGAPKLENFAQIISVNITPGKLFEGRAALGSFADHITQTSGHPTQVLCLEGGSHYQHFVALSFDDLAQYEAVWAAAETDEAVGPIVEAIEQTTATGTMEKNIVRYI